MLPKPEQFVGVFTVRVFGVFLHTILSSPLFFDKRLYFRLSVDQPGLRLFFDQ